jgi:hypothetical protein
MLRRTSEHSLSESQSDIQGHGLKAAARAPEPAVQPQTPMERKMSQTFIQANAPRSGRVGSSPEALARPVIDGLLALARRFMIALCESRQRQADQVIQRYRHLIDRSDD